MRKLYPIVLLLLLLCSAGVKAQDIHYSMFYASPLTLNPALTGIHDGSYRVAGIYRNQWRSVSTAFHTYSASYDMKLLQAKLKNDVFAIGGMFTGDKSGDGKLTMNTGMVSIAYHKGLDKNRKHSLGLGIQLGYTQKNLKYQQLTFPQQFDGSEFDPTINNGENITKPSIGYFDMQAGFLHQSMIKDIVGFTTGLTVYHLTRPSQSFMGDKTAKLSMRFAVQEGIRIKVHKNVFITPNFIYQYQNKAQEINFGTSVEYRALVGKTDLVASIGGWYRLNDAAIITAGLELYRVRVMAAYDINVSKLRPASTGRGGFELAIIYTGFIKSNKVNYPVLVPCPMM